MKTIESTETFHQVIAGSKTVIVKFETTWCPDCKRLNTYADELVNEFQFDWYAADRDRLPELGKKYEVLGVPSLLAFKNGKKIAHLRADNQSPEEIREFLRHIEA